MKNQTISLLNGILILVLVLLVAGCTEQKMPDNHDIVIPEPGESQKVDEPTLNTIPSESVSTEPVELLFDGVELEGVVGQPFSYVFEATGGLPPYHFQLESGVGFPPMGLILDINGKLSGTPSAEGTSTFKVCAVDTAGYSNCNVRVMSVSEPKVELQIAVTDKNCKFVRSFGSNGNGYAMELTGTASGPVGAFLYAPFAAEYAAEYGVKFECSTWGRYSKNDFDITTCKRGEGEPEQTEWMLKDPEWASSSSGNIISITSPDFTDSKSTEDTKGRC